MHKQHPTYDVGETARCYGETKGDMELSVSLLGPLERLLRLVDGGAPTGQGREREQLLTATLKQLGVSERSLRCR